MKYLSPKKGFLGIDAEQSKSPQVIVVPFGLEKTVSYGGDTKNGPKEIIKASHQVELYDEELNCEPFKKIGIKTLKPFKIHKNINKALEKFQKNEAGNVLYELKQYRNRRFNNLDSKINEMKLLLKIFEPSFIAKFIFIYYCKLLRLSS